MDGEVSHADRSVEVGPSECPDPGYMDQGPKRAESRYAPNRDPGTLMFGGPLYESYASLRVIVS